MKALTSLLLLASLSAPAQALAYPAVGDFARYSTIAKMGDMTMKLEIRVELVSKREDGKFLGRVIQLMDGEVLSDETSEAKGLFDRAQILDILARCETPEIGGKSQVITTPAGTFPVCTAPAEDGAVVSLADVPFGIVKLVQKDEEMTQVMTLVEFRAGS